jgi:hypothetical protein
MEAARTKSDGAKLALIFWRLLASIGSGFDHVVANMTIFSLGLFDHVPGATSGTFAGNLMRPVIDSNPCPPRASAGGRCRRPVVAPVVGLLASGYLRGQ